MDNDLDEIIFVDYNTPDVLPTFTESIIDTLSIKARSLLRTLRVREHSHNGCYPNSSLSVIEPLARNVALRRSNPLNKWVLSTNTDILFLCENDESFSTILRDLDPGFLYGVPRLELPEGVWGRFDRSNQSETAAILKQLHSNQFFDEIIVGVPEVGYDNPGDFQLAARDALFAIDGFDERMADGWHVDHNLAKRLGLYLGAEPKSLGNKLVTYHCGHTKQPSSTHKGNHSENDTKRFVTSVLFPEIPQQHATWGLFNSVVEEVDITDSPFIHKLLSTKDNIASADIAPQRLISHYNGQGFGSYYYDSRKVVAHIADYLRTISRDIVISYFGCRRDTFISLVDWLDYLGFHQKVLVPDELEICLDAIGLRGVQAVPRDNALVNGSLIIFEFGLLRDGSGRGRSMIPVPDDLRLGEITTLDAVEKAYREFVVLERTIPDRSRRPALVVNAVHTPHEPLVRSSLNSPPIPFSTRLRYGKVFDADTCPAKPESDLEFNLLQVEINGYTRTAPCTRDELAEIYRLTTVLAKAAALEEPNERSFRLDVLGQADFIQELLVNDYLDNSFNKQEIEIIDRNLRLLIEQELSLSPTSVLQPKRLSYSSNLPLSGLATIMSWNDAGWLDAVELLRDKGTRSASLLKNGWIWARAQALYAIGSGIQSDNHILVVSGAADLLMRALAREGSCVNVLDVGLFNYPDEKPLKPSTYWVNSNVLDVSKIKSVGFDTVPDCTLRAAIVMPTATSAGGWLGLSRLIELIEASLEIDGRVVFLLDVDILPIGASAFTFEGLTTFVDDLERFTNLLPLGSLHPSIDIIDSTLVGSVAERGAGLPILGIAEGGKLSWPATIVLSKAAETSKAAWRSLKEAVAERELGEQIGKMRMREGAIRHPDGSISITDAVPEGHAIFGPYLSLEKGQYVARIVISDVSSGSLEASRLVSEVVVGGKIIARFMLELQRHQSDNLSQISDFEMFFSYNNDGHQTFFDLLEVRLWSPGNTALTILSVTVVKAVSSYEINQDGFESDVTRKTDAEAHIGELGDDPTSFTMTALSQNSDAETSGNEGESAVEEGGRC